MRRLTALVFAVAAITLFARLGTLPLLQPDEGRNAEVAREMKHSGAWLVPTYDGLPYLDKPAAYFRLVALSLEAFGENETAARLPGALFGLAVVGLAYAFARRAYGRRAAALAVLVVATTPAVVAFARIVIFDMVLAFFVIGAIVAGYVAEEYEGAARARWYLAAAAAAGVATLVKGPVGFFLPILVLTVWHLLERRPGALRRTFAPANMLLFLVIVLPWFFGVALRRPDFPYYGLVEETFHRLVTPAFHRTAPFWYYVPVIAALFFPWSVLLPESALAAWRARARLTRADRLLLVWAVVVPLFFSLSQSKLPGYVLTAVVALGILVARVLDLAFERPGARAHRLAVRGAWALAAAAAAVTVIAALGAGRGAPGGLLVAAGGTELARLQPALAPLAWAFGAVALLSAAAGWRRDLRLACAAFAVPPLLLLTVAFGGARAYAEADSARSLARQVPALAPGVELACLECLPNGLPFYLGRTITLVTRDGNETTSNYVTFLLRRTSAWPPGVVRLDGLDRWLAWRDHPVFLMADAPHRGALDSLAAAYAVPVRALAARWWGALLPVARAGFPAPAPPLPAGAERR